MLSLCEEKLLRFQRCGRRCFTLIGVQVKHILTSRAQGAHFSKVVVTFLARNQIFKSNTKE